MVAVCLGEKGYLAVDEMSEGLCFQGMDQRKE